MNDVRVERDVLLKKLTANRDAHRDLFLTAQSAFRERVIEELDAMLKAARDGALGKLAVGLIAPQDHTADYNRAIAMLEMCVDKVVAIDEHSFQCFVLDEWAWTVQAGHINRTYSLGGKLETR